MDRYRVFKKKCDFKEKRRISTVNDFTYFFWNILMETGNWFFLLTWYFRTENIWPQLIQNTIINKLYKIW